MILHGVCPDAPVVTDAAVCALFAVWLLFRPNWLLDQFSAPYRDAPPATLMQVVDALPDGDRLIVRIKGQTIEGEDTRKTLALPLGPKADARKRLTDAGLSVSIAGDTVQIIGVKFGSKAKKAGFEQGWAFDAIQLPADRPDVHWVYVPGLALVALVWWLQGRRARR